MRFYNSAHRSDIKIDMRGKFFLVITVGIAALYLQLLAERQNFSFSCCDGLRHSVNFSVVKQPLTLG